MSTYGTFLAILVGNPCIPLFLECVNDGLYCMFTRVYNAPVLVIGM